MSAGEPQNGPGGEEWLDKFTDDNGDVLGDEPPDPYRYQPTEHDVPLPPYDWVPSEEERARVVQRIVKPPSRTKRVLCSLPFYLLVMVIPTVAFWVLARLAHTTTTRWVAIGVTVVAVGLCILRAVRGSLIDAERDVATELLTDTPEVSNRLARQLWDGEIVEWETRRHPISIVPTVLRRLTASKWRRRSTFVYLVVLGIAWYMNVWAGVGAVVVGVLAVGFTIMEWARVRYAFTTERIMAVEKLIGKSVPAMPRSKLTDIVVSEHWFAVLLAWLRIVRVPWGTWNVETAGQDQALKYIYFLPAAVIAAAVFSLGRSSSGGDGT